MFEKYLESCESTGIESLELKDVATEYILAVLKVSENFPSLTNLSCSEMKSQVQNKEKVQAMVCQNDVLVVTVWIFTEITNEMIFLFIIMIICIHIC